MYIVKQKIYTREAFYIRRAQSAGARVPRWRAPRGSCLTAHGWLSSPGYRCLGVNHPPQQLYVWGGVWVRGCKMIIVKCSEVKLMSPKHYKYSGMYPEVHTHVCKTFDSTSLPYSYRYEWRVLGCDTNILGEYIHKSEEVERGGVHKICQQNLNQINGSLTGKIFCKLLLDSGPLL